MCYLGLGFRVEWIFGLILVGLGLNGFFGLILVQNASKQRVGLNGLGFRVAMCFGLNVNVFCFVVHNVFWFECVAR
ncbi:hypothetical protein Hdeb2414_s0007g00230171 [Helianthus debilis subsp. tardiflorus]